MRKTLHLLIAAGLATLALAGCVENDPEEAGGDAGTERTLAVDVPEGADALLVEVTAWDHAANETTTVHVVVEDDAREQVLAEQSFGVVNESRHEFEVDVVGHDRVQVTASVVEGAADVEIAVWAIVEGEEPTVIVRERVIVYEEPEPASPSPTPTASPTPTPEGEEPAANETPTEATPTNETTSNETSSNESTQEP